MRHRTNAGRSQSACSRQVSRGGDIDGDCALHWRAASPQLSPDVSLYSSSILKLITTLRSAHINLGKLK